MFLFKVANTFQITGRGLIVVPGLGTKTEKVKVGIAVRLKRPDNTEVLTKIAGIEFAVNAPLLLPEEIRKEEVPIGTEVWLDV